MWTQPAPDRILFADVRAAGAHINWGAMTR